MKIKLLILFSILLIIFTVCDQNIEYTKVKIGDVIKISSDYSAYDKADIIFAWNPPTSNDGSIPKFEIDNNSLYFSPYAAEKYTMTLSIETLEGDPIIKEKYYYEGVEQLDNLDKTYKNVRFPSEPITETKEIKKKENVQSSYFTIQIYARRVKEEAFADSDGLNALGFEDIFIEKFIKKNTNYWRVRSGKLNTMKKAEKRKEELSNVLKINLSDLWLVEVK